MPLAAAAAGVDGIPEPVAEMLSPLGRRGAAALAALAALAAAVAALAAAVIVKSRPPKLKASMSDTVEYGIAVSIAVTASAGVKPVLTKS